MEVEKAEVNLHGSKEELDTLREYLSSVLAPGRVQDHRSTASEALEQLKTARHNANVASLAGWVQLQLTQLNMFLEFTEESLPRAKELLEKLKGLDGLKFKEPV